MYLQEFHSPLEIKSGPQC
uniref:Uncharacterized protein n=1 Tax=Anguilla anguilla TaxID=7936 RepID=A0A0E9PG77_ANGAN